MSSQTSQISQSTHIIVVLDESGSMEVISSNVVSGFNEFLQFQKKIQDSSRLTLIKFSETVKVLFENIPLSDVPELSDENYCPDGTTALNDAIGKAVNIDPTNTKTLVVIITDGFENSSSTYKERDIEKLIENRTSLNGWKFIYLCNSKGTSAQGSSMGFQTSQDHNPSTQNLIVNEADFGNILSRQISQATSAYRQNQGVSNLSVIDSSLSSSPKSSPPRNPQHYIQNSQHSPLHRPQSPVGNQVFPSLADSPSQNVNFSSPNFHYLTPPVPPPPMPSLNLPPPLIRARHSVSRSIFPSPPLPPPSMPPPSLPSMPPPSYSSRED